MKKILITGGGGQLGRECADLFAKRFNVISLSSKELDITDPDSVITVFESNRPDIVINCA
ncbi:MAG: sugar nucleotide-binding protein, partial [Desulfobulbaceae bacterium]|nr:sugar nucleotide-binding protein [Desulfobulbaceae bacterium]